MDLPAEFASWLLETWTGKLADSIETMTGERPAIEGRAGALDTTGEVLWWEQPFGGVPFGTVWIGAPRAAWLDLGTLTLRGAGIETSEPGDARSTYLEILSQALSGLAQAAGGRLGREVTCEAGQEAPPGSQHAGFTVQVTLGAYSATLAFCASQGLAQELGVIAAPPQLPAPATEAAPGLPAGEGKPQTLELLMDVELPVSVSFGRAELALKDVLKLATGSIVELNRSIVEPVEVIVNNCVIARGEVVVVDGNYGVRVQEIISRQNRLRTLK